jgi:hypothetical protein
VLVVFQQLQVEGVQATVGGVDQAGKHLAVAQGGVDQAGVHLADVFAGQVHVVQLDHAGQAVGAVGELGVQRHQAVFLGFAQAWLRSLMVLICGCSSATFSAAPGRRCC